MPRAGSGRAFARPSPLLFVGTAPGVFFDQLPHGVVLEREIRDDAAQTAVLVIDGATASHLAALHAAVLGLPSADGVRVHAVPPAELDERCAGVMLLEN